MVDDGNGMMKLGPVGSRTNGKAWDEKGRTKISQIFISHGDRMINSVQFQYVENGRLKLSERHGNNVIGNKFDAVQLNHATEYITWISGHKNFSTDAVCSVTFGTNHGQYGPFGTFKPADAEFRFNLGAHHRQFGGFHGTVYSSSPYSVNSIGVYLNPNLVIDDGIPISRNN